MTFISLDEIVCNLILKRKYPWHYYLDFIVPAKDALREIAFDMPILPIRYCVLPVDQAGNIVTLPNDFQDYITVSAWVDQYIRPLVETDSIQLVPNYDSSFNVQPYSQGIATNTAAQNQYVLYNNSLSGYWWMATWNSFGENMGRQFGGVGGMWDTFRMNKGANQIKINENLYVTQIILEYISDGMDADSATRVDSYAQQAIEQYCMWQFKEHNRTYSAGEAENEKQMYIMEAMKLRARLSDLSVDRLKRIVQGNAIAVKY